jgi:hypothetical protein
MRRAATALLLLLFACGGNEPGREVQDQALVQTARDVVALLGGYNCRLLPQYLTADGPDYFRLYVRDELLDGMMDPVERVCFVLGVIQDYPRSETMQVRAETQSLDRADLILTDGSVEAEVRMVRDPEGWKIEKEWAVNQVRNLDVRMDLLRWAIDEDEYYYYGPKAFTDDPAELAAGTRHAVAPFVPGVATSASGVGMIHASLGPRSQSVCGSVRSLSGELFMLRQAANGSSSYARGASLPQPCPGSPLAPSW